MKLGFILQRDYIRIYIRIYLTLVAQFLAPPSADWSSLTQTRWKTKETLAKEFKVIMSANCQGFAGGDTQDCQAETDSVSCCSCCCVYKLCALFLLCGRRSAFRDAQSHAPPPRGQPAHVRPLMRHIRLSVVWLTWCRLCSHLLGLIHTKEWSRALSP